MGGPVLFVYTYITYIAENIRNNSDLYLYADDTTMFTMIQKPVDGEILQDGVYDTMSSWSDKYTGPKL